MSTKRRKPDNAADEQLRPESSPALPKVPRRTYGKQTQSSPAANTNGADFWLQVKPTARQHKSKERKEKQMDIYDDIDGANEGHYPYGRLDEGKGRPQKRRKTEESVTPQKRKTLDPLMNQKSQESVTPKKTAAPGLGFFKQFGKDKARASEANRSRRASAVVERKANATHTDESEAEEDEGAKEDSAQKSRVPGVGSMRGYVYGKHKKTFEDEIRELEEQARNGAAEKEAADELASASETPRPSARKASQRISSARPQPEQKQKTSSRKASTQPLDRRKAKSPSPVDAEEEQVEDDVPDLEIDESDDEQVVHAEPEPPEVVEEAPPFSTPRKASSKSTKKGSAKDMTTFDPDHLQIIQKTILEKSTGKRSIPLTNLADEYAKVYSVINQTVTAGESNSMLLIGARGSGKTALINQILAEQTSKHPDDFHAIRLNGFIHTDDKIALREIWRQLGREMELDEDESTSKSYADTMSKLLALLSHPAEMGAERNSDQITKSVIFVLDEFELFAGHPRQTLLYNLFDIAQSRKAPIAVLGLTTRIDVAESLEKRVKSRFSHRYVHLSLSKSFQAFEQVCRRALELTTKELSGDEVQSLGKTTKTQEESTGPKIDVPVTLVNWTSVVDQLLASKDVAAYLQRLYYTTKSVPEFLSAITLALATMPISPETTVTSLVDHISTSLTSSSIQPPDSKLTLLSTLSTLQLALLVCAARLTNIYATEIISFALVYEEYKVLASKAKLQASASGALAQGAGNRVWSKDVARGAWEGLGEFGLIVMQAGGTGRVDVGLEEIGGSGVELGIWGRWCKEI